MHNFLVPKWPRRACIN